MYLCSLIAGLLVFFSRAVSNEAIVWTRIRALAKRFSMLNSKQQVENIAPTEMESIVERPYWSSKLFEERLFQMDQKIRYQNQIISALRKANLQIKNELHVRISQLNLSHAQKIMNITSAIKMKSDFALKKKIDEIEKANCELVKQIEEKHKLEIDSMQLAAKNEVRKRKDSKNSENSVVIKKTFDKKKRNTKKEQE